MSTAVDVALACNLTVRRVQQLAKEGILPRVAPGVYEKDACTLAYVRYLQAALVARSTMDGAGKISSMNQQRLRLLEVEVRSEELALAKASGEVLSVADHEAVVADLVRMTRAVFAAVGSRVASQLVDGMNRADRQAVIDAGNRGALMQLAALVPRTPAKMSRAEIKAVIDTGIKEALHAVATNEQKLPDGTPRGMRAPAKKRAAKKRTSKKRGPKKQAPAA